MTWEMKSFVGPSQDVMCIKTYRTSESDQDASASWRKVI